MVAMKGVLPDTTPMFVGAIRLIPAGILVLLVATWQKRPQPTTWLGWGWILLFAVIDATCFQGFLAQGLERTGAGLGSVIIDSQPIAVALLSSWLFKEVIGGIGWLGLLAGVLGIGLIGLPDDWFFQLWQTQRLDIAWSQESLWQSGELWMLFASLSMAVGVVLIPFVSRHVDPVVATGWHMIVGGLPLLAIALGESAEPWQHLTVWDWGNLAYSTIFGSALAYGLFFMLAARSNLTSFTALTFLTPVFALSFGNLLLGEELSSLQWLGVFLTLISIYLINQRQDIPRQWQSLITLIQQSSTPDQEKASS